jgi:hypothetical protein
MKRLSNTTLLTSAHKTETSALASLSSSASVLAERVSPACPPLAPFPAPEASIPVRPYWDACPSGSLLLLQLHVHIQPLRSTVITRFPATMGCPTPAKKNLAGIPGSSAYLSSRAAPTHPGEPDGCIHPLLHHRWQASSASTDWPLPLG